MFLYCIRLSLQIFGIQHWRESRLAIVIKGRLLRFARDAAAALRASSSSPRIWSRLSPRGSTARAAERYETGELFKEWHNILATVRTWAAHSVH